VEAVVSGRQILRHLMPSVHLGSGPAEVHIALDTSEALTRLRVRWPDGSVQDLREVPLGRRVTVRQGRADVAEEELPAWSSPDSKEGGPAAPH